MRQLSGPERELFQEGIRLFESGQFFECHEVWEEIWRPARGPSRLFLQSLIHLAVGLHQARNENFTGAGRQLRKGLRKLAGYLPCAEGIDTLRLYRESLVCLDQMERGETARQLPRLRPRHCS